MKKTLKFALVVSIIFSLLSGNIAVLAADVANMANEEPKKIEMQAPATQVPEQSAQPDQEATPETTEETTPTVEESFEPQEETTSEEDGIMLMDTGTPEPQSGIPNVDSLPGSVELKIDLRLPQQNLVVGNVVVTLKNQETGAETRSTDKQTGQANEKQLFYTFNDLTAGKYKLTISGAGYQKFETADGAITVKPNTTTALNFTNGYDASFVDPATGASRGTGIIRLGDVNGSEDVTEDDQTELIDKLEGTDKGLYYDLNQDGTVDIVDLSYVAINKGTKMIGPKEKHITNLVMEDIKSETTTGSYYIGTTDPEGKPDPTLATDIKEVLENNDKHVTLQPANTEDIISEDNPIEIGLNIENDTSETEYISIAPSQNVDNNITDGVITVDGLEYVDGEAKQVEVVCQIQKRNPSSTPESSPSATEMGEQGDLDVKVLGVFAKDESITSDIMPIAESPDPSTEPTVEPLEGGVAYVEDDGSITVDFGAQIAVKRVVIKVTGTQGSRLADIAKVEFLNGMSEKIPEPQLGIPTLRTQEIDDSVTEESYTIRWNNVPNVTGYKVQIRAEINGKEETEIHENIEGHELKLEQFKGKAIKDLISENNYKDYTKYYITVYSVNGEWQSAPSEEYTVQPKPTSKPNPVTGVTAKGGYKSIKVSWNADRRASEYYVYCREKGQKDWNLVSGTADDKLGTGLDKNTTSFNITEMNGEALKSLQTYEVTVRARNSIGISDIDENNSVATADTLDVKEVELPNYRRINKKGERGEVSPAITNIWYQTDGIKRSMKDSPLDVDASGNALAHPTDKSLRFAKGLVDNSFSSYFECTDWDAGGFYDGNDKCIVVEFDQAYTMNYLTLAKVQWDGSFQNATLRYEDENGNKNVRVRASLVAQRKDSDGNYYTAIKLAKPITTKRLVVGIGGGGRVTVAEMGFYNYDPIEDEIEALFKDSMHLTLADNIKAMDQQTALDTVQKIEDKINTPEQESNEISPEAENLKKELETARTLIKNGDLGRVTKINSTMSTWFDTKTGDNNKDIEFKGSLNGWQPLGVSARGGEEITVYVGNPYKTTRETTRLQLIYTQWRAEAGNWQSTVISPLKVGANTITLPDLITSNREHGGSLYINYTGLKEDDPTRYMDREYAVRVSGGNEIPVLDLSKEEVLDPNYGKATRQAISAEERKQRITDYIDALEENVSTLEQRHNDECMHYDTKYQVQDFGQGEDCILGATEIVLDDMMYSVSSKQIWDGLTEKGYKSKEDKIAGLEKTLKAMEDMMELFYNQKGLSKEDTGAEYAHTFPRTRQNIRCMRMTGSAFMYAGGQHIGIQWNEVKDLAKGVPFEVAENGSVTNTDGNYFGWGIAHEIGHVINQQAYVHGEVTNNYFSILAQTNNTRDTVRFNYKDVYDKVTSGKKGKAQNVFTQLALYWQLHLAYDLGGYNYKKLNTQKSQLEDGNAIFARMDTYARDTKKAPKGKSKQVDLTLTDSKDDNLMRLACAATKSNILYFFEKWGMEPNAETVEYASQFEQGTKAIQYVNDESRNYMLEWKYPVSLLQETTGKELELTANISNAVNNRVDGNEVKFDLNVQDEFKDAILGYEIVRTYIEKDPNSLESKEITRPVAFVEGDKTSYTDVVSTINNRVFTYKVVAYDKYLEKVAEKTLEPVKVSHKGEIDKTDWQITTNATSSSDKSVSYDPTNKQVDASDEVQVISGASALADKDKQTPFEASVKEGNVEITVELPEVKKLVGLKYYANAQIENYKIEVSNDNENWTTVKSNEPENSVMAKVANFFSGNKQRAVYNGEETLYFTKVGEDGKNEIYNYDYDCTYVKFTIYNTQISINEIDLIGQTGDNVEFRENENEAVGLNADKFVYSYNEDGSEQYSIPKDAMVFTGKYKGNPAYNMVLLWYKETGSDKWEIVEGYQVILADDPGEADLGETNDGNWIFVVEPQTTDEEGNTSESQFYTRMKERGGEVRAELYRVDEAQKLEGERCVSDTLNLTLPTEFKSITLTDDRTKNN